MPAAKRNAHLLVKLFVAFHLVAIIAWSLPNPPEAVRNGTIEPTGTMIFLNWNWQTFKNGSPIPEEGQPGRAFGYFRHYNPVRFYDMSLGNWQYWDMFAPDPSNVDLWGDAEVFYKDGSMKRWQYPRIYDMPLWKKYFMERYRKFFERASSDQFSYMFPPFAQRVAYINWTDPNNPPVRVKLYRHTMLIPQIGTPRPTEYESFMYFEWEVDQARLKEMKEEGWSAKSALLSNR